MNIFQKTYTLRRYAQQVICNGYAELQFSDATVRLDVQPISGTDLEVIPEGDRAVKRLKSFGASNITAADQNQGIIGDRLLYCGKWYECESSDKWDHGILAHCESRFALVPEGEEGLEGGDRAESDGSKGTTI